MAFPRLPVIWIGLCEAAVSSRSLESLDRALVKVTDVITSASDTKRRLSSVWQTPRGPETIDDGFNMVKIHFAAKSAGSGLHHGLISLLM